MTLAHRVARPWLAIVLALAPVWVAAQSARPAMSDFTWAATASGLFLEQVRFANGDLAQVARGPMPGRELSGACDIARLEIRRGRTGELLSLTHACDSYVHMVAAHPSATPAQVANITTNISGTTSHSYNN